MNTNPVNLAARFLLEIAMLLIVCCWGWHLSTGWLRYAAAAGCPVIAAILWGVFRIQNDPKPAPVETPGPVRLLLELVLFGWAVWALRDLGRPGLSGIMAIVVVLHYLVSYDRTWAMLRNRPYKGFVK
ncbi:MAG TPA: YrdB family protein [Mucilaginibacter sp.]|jgi:hypothetical protein|nr:YrdB family protein [Mucilaginibacter sp.]